MDFSYDIQYKCGKENLVVNTLSRVSGSEMMCMALSIQNFQLGAVDHS